MSLRNSSRAIEPAGPYSCWFLHLLCRAPSSDAPQGLSHWPLWLSACAATPAAAQDKPPVLATQVQLGFDTTEAAVAKALAYLPASARVAATIYLVRKPEPVSFVYGLQRDPSLMMYLDPKQSVAQFENTIAHELHHIGFTTIGAKADEMVSPLKLNVRIAADWTRAFGEGFVMLAAAGGPDVNPHATSPLADRTRWAEQLTHFNRDLKAIEGFFVGVIDGRIATPDDIAKGANEFYGVQGPWYTVGWKMTVTIEKKFGRAEVVECMVDPYRLLTQYNEAAADWNKMHAAAKLAVWAPELIAAFKRPG